MISTMYSHRNFFELPDVRKNFVALVGLKSQKHVKRRCCSLGLSFRVKIEKGSKTLSRD